MKDEPMTGPDAARDPTSGNRALSGAELLLGAAVVLGHNVFHALPNEVPILVLMGLVSARLRDGGAGVVDSGVAGLILAAAYMLSGRSLWASILAHGLIDTFAVVVVFLGLATPD